MPILKGEKSKSVLKNAIVLDMGDLDRQARDILAQARRDAASVVAEARDEAKKLIAEAADIGQSQGFERGRAEGFEQGRAEGREETLNTLKPQLEEMLKSWSDALDRWESDRADMLLAARQDVLTFAVEMGRKLTLRYMALNEDAVVDQVAEAISRITRPTAVSILVHSDDRALIEDALPDLLAKFTGCREAVIREEPNVERGGCIVKTSGGEIDATLKTQIERIIEALLPAPSQPEKEGA